MKEIVAVSDLEIGMFVTDLDRPWIESPFMLQGFLIDDQETLTKLRETCRFVSIDRERSVGEWHRARPAEDVASTVGRSLRGQVPREPAAPGSAGGDGSLPEFMEILRLIRSGRLEELPKVRPEDLDPIPQAESGPLPERRRATPAEPWQPAAERRRVSRLFDPWRGILRRGELGAAVAQGGADPAEIDAHSTRIRERTRVERELLYVAPRFVETRVALEKVLSDIRSSLDPDLGKLREGVEDMVRSVARNPDALLWLTRLKATDEGSYQHALHTSVHMMIFARALGMGEDSTRLLGMAGMLHDVGKVRLPPRLLRKNDRLTPLEYEIFKTHVDFSLAILDDSPEITPELVEIVARHHERIDGSGYPHSLSGDEIGMNAEIAGLVDSYTAMTNLREYSSVYSTHQALEDLIRLRGTKYRESLVDQFVQCIGIYPVGSLVELNTGEVAVVIGQNRVRRLRPRVMVLLAPDKSQNPYPPPLDLLYDPPTPTGEVYAIVRALPPDAYGIDPQEFYLG